MKRHAPSRFRQVEQPGHRRAFTTIELLISMGIVVLLLSLAVPLVQRTHMQARRVANMANIRTCGIAVAGYALDNRELPPVLFPPIYHRLGDPPFTVIVRGTEVRGAWFTNNHSFVWALDPLLPPEALRIAGNPDRRTITIGGEVTRLHPDFHIAECLYATPEYWTHEFQLGPRQWRAQRLDAINFPAFKGLMRQHRNFESGTEAEGDWALVSRTPTAILWGDMSVSMMRVAEMRKGVPNRFYGTRPPYTEAYPFDRTLWGVRGRDR